MFRFYLILTYYCKLFLMNQTFKNLYVNCSLDLYANTTLCKPKVLE